MRAVVPSSAQLMAVVKADAYGHGAVRTARAALSAGASALAVAVPEEGVQLRMARITAPVLVLGLTNVQGAEECVRYGLTMTVCSRQGVFMAEIAAYNLASEALVHLKLDTGMGRIGARDEVEVRAVLKAIEECPDVRLTGAFTHFADADGDDMAYTREQLRRFRELTAILPPGLTLHCANSAAIHRLMPEAAFDMVRMGISLYGYPPVETDCSLTPAMSWTAEVTWVKDLPAGETVSYGRTWRADGTRRIATIACGYGDGYHRAASGRAEVLLHGKRAPVVGRICMDQMMADVTDIPGVQPGDQAVLMGQDGEERITAEDIARWSGTISYEVLLAAKNRVERRWLHG
ncbi:MAG: alanine racemase [Clostridia bacterium]|nr:alanine racemase [Clostridia bacterium]